MQINTNTRLSKQSFKGWDATVPLKSLLLTEPGYNCKFAEELDVIGKNSGFDVFVLSDQDLRPMSYINEEIPASPLTLQRQKFIEKISLLRKMIKAIYNPNTPRSMKRGFIKNRDISSWAQDIVTITPNQHVHYDIGNLVYASAIMNKLGISVPQNLPNLKHVQGGNMFFVKNDEGYELLVGALNKPELVLGSNLKKSISSGEIDYDYLREFFGVNKVIFLPQMDFHLDLFVRPLDKKNILVTDDDMTMNTIKKGIEIFKKASNDTGDAKKSKLYADINNSLCELFRYFKGDVRFNNYNDVFEVISVLEKEKYKVIKVPGRLYNLYHDDYATLNEIIDPKHLFNYMNAIVTKNKQDELVYITNKSTLDKSIGITPEIAREVGFSFEDEFKKSICEYVKPENVHFISGEYDGIQEKLYNQGGGIHCLTTEIPDL